MTDEQARKYLREVKKFYTTLALHHTQTAFMNSLEQTRRLVGLERQLVDSLATPQTEAQT